MWAGRAREPASLWIHFFIKFLRWSPWGFRQKHCVIFNAGSRDLEDWKQSVPAERLIVINSILKASSEPCNLGSFLLNETDNWNTRRLFVVFVAHFPLSCIWCRRDVCGNHYSTMISCHEENIYIIAFFHSMFSLSKWKGARVINI